MKTFLTKLFIFSLLIVSAVSCTKKDDPLPTQVVNLDTKGVHDITAISAVVDAKAKASCTERGVCWGKAPNPTLDDFHIANGSGKGEYSCTLTDLEPNQKYYYRAYAADGERIAYALDEKSFTTKDGIVHLTTGYVTDITAISATCSGNITDDGACPVTERGICFGTSPNPTLEDARHIAAGSGTGEFSVELADLTPELTYHVRAYATSILGTTYADDEKNFITRDGIPVVATGDISEIMATTAICSGNVTDDGGCPVTERGFCYGTSPNPTLGNAEHIAVDNGTGEFSATLTNLTINTTYFVRAYAINGLEPTYAQDEKNFTTKDGVAVIITHDVSEITAISAKCSGKVIDDGGFEVTERGFCYGTSPNPTLGNAEHIAIGSGIGEFSTTLTDLMINTTYFVRAYAINGPEPTYAQDEKEFTTEDGKPIVTTCNISEITDTSAKCSGNVTGDGGFAVTERGFCWSTSPNPTFENNAQHESVGDGTGSFSLTLTDLEESTTYYVCIYARNINGIRYGEEVSFSTAMTTLVFNVNGVVFRMIGVEGGTFTMGATSEQCNDAQTNEYPTHSVTLSSFYMGETEVTQALWKAVTGDDPFSWNNDSHPAFYVSWNNCQEFITMLNSMCAEQLNGKSFRLPTEAEWEYAARGGKYSHSYRFSGSNDLNWVAYYYDNSYQSVQPVGRKRPNELGLYDMSGNVYEWCQDGPHAYSSESQVDPCFDAITSAIYRGGCFRHAWSCCRVSYRGGSWYVNESFNALGLRLVLR